jgi:hypothetical protein
VMISHTTIISKKGREVNLPNPLQINDLRYALERSRKPLVRRT